MKLPLLPACFAVTAVAATAALTDPAQVAADWNKTFEEASRPLLTPGPLGLTVAPPNPMAAGSAGVSRVLRPKRNGDVLEVPPDWQPDPKMVHGNQSDTPPSGAKPWYYRGQKFWIIPIAAEGK